MSLAGRDQLDAMPSLPEDGLLGAIGSVNVNHNLEGEDGVFEQGGGAILPKMIEVTIDFSPIHESHLGWFEDGTFGSDAFPYGAIPDPDYYQAHGYSAAEADQGADAREEGTEGDSLDPDASAGDADTSPDPPPNETPLPGQASANETAAFEGSAGDWLRRKTALKTQALGAMVEEFGRQLTAEERAILARGAHAEFHREQDAFRAGDEDWRDQ
jgi:hypothetical protein